MQGCTVCTVEDSGDAVQDYKCKRRQIEREAQYHTVRERTSKPESTPVPATTAHGLLLQQITTAVMSVHEPS